MRPSNVGSESALQVARAANVNRFVILIKNINSRPFLILDTYAKRLKRFIS